MRRLWFLILVVQIILVPDVFGQTALDAKGKYFCQSRALYALVKGSLQPKDALKTIKAQNKLIKKLRLKLKSASKAQKKKLNNSIKAAKALITAINQCLQGAFDVPVSISPTLGLGSLHSCAIGVIGTVRCWGSNSNNQLGGVSGNSSNVPTAIADTSAYMVVAGGEVHTCGVTATGAAKCWGRNVFGQSGTGNNSEVATPTQVVGLTSGVQSITCGLRHSCALMSSGAVKCWGYNSDGELGNGGPSDSNTPVDVTGLSSGVTAVQAGDFHTCALLNSGGIKCWGYNASGQLGNGSPASSNIPVDVAGLPGRALSVSGGATHTCAVIDGGSVVCWGSNGSGQLGNSGGSTTSAVAANITGVSAIAAGDSFTCALVSGGGIKCWGLGNDGRLGNGSTTSSAAPVDVIGLASPASLLSVGQGHACALLTNSSVQCWGANGSGQLGNSTTTSSSTPVTVSGTPIG